MAGRLLLLVALALVGDPAFAQTATPTPVFTIADVHPSPWIHYSYMNGGTLHGDRYTLRQATMIDLIANAYSIDPKTIHGGPAWLEFDRFDVVAQAPAGTPAATLKLMLRSLLGERFGLATHKGMAWTPAWILTAVKPKLVEVPGGTPECAPAKPSVSSTPMYAVACHSMPMDQFAPILQLLAAGYLDNTPVVDSTGLKGKYDFEYQWSPRAELARAGSDGSRFSMRWRNSGSGSISRPLRVRLLPSTMSAGRLRRTRPVSRRRCRRSRHVSSRSRSSSPVSPASSLSAPLAATVFRTWPAPLKS
ncbi:MAG TPA: TIGR03435 family protein [Acidobacteriaceae bacterium]|jgi:uncharacterized protein (TIGR03435 family)|nr:TIGR03435 family protein [Acidobacteriaceae bacterium]